MTEIGRTTVVFPNIQVKFDCLNMFECSKMVKLTLLGRELGDHLTEDLVLKKDPRYKKWKVEEVLMHQ